MIAHMSSAAVRLSSIEEIIKSDRKKNYDEMTRNERLTSDEIEKILGI